MTRVVVTGVGIISSLGNNLEETHNSLISQESGISNIDILETNHSGDFLVGEVKQAHNELIKLAEVDETIAWTRTALLGIIAAKQAIKDSEINNYNNVALVSASTVGGMDRSELYYKDFLTEAKNFKYIDSHHAGNSTEMIAEQCGIDGLITTISTACSSSLNSIMFGARLIKNGKTNCAIVGGTDALSKFTLNGFNTLMILDKGHCRPFDSTRTGLNLGEGAAYLVLEDMDTAIAASKKIYAEVSGYANANDAFHQTASSNNGEGPFLAMQNALSEAKLSPGNIDYINAHGTGTDNNDLTEGVAIKRLFGDSIPPFSSTKAYTGHTLGAAGVIESVISIIALTEKIIPPNINFKNVIPDIGIEPVTELMSLDEMNHVITNSFGFGGNDSSVIFSNVNQNITESDSEISFNTHQAYIVGLGCVSPQNTLSRDTFLDEVFEIDDSFLQILKPNYRDYIDPKQLRRMSKIVRMGIVSAKVAVKDAGIDNYDAIVTGTGMGCQIDTEKFLNSMIENDEGLLTPTSFIQSTHNTVGGSIALGNNNHNYNLTYVHRTFSFESALLDGLMLLNEEKASNILLGGFDEITDESWLIKTKIGHYKSKPSYNLNIYSDEQEGAQAGEGSSFFMLSNKSNDNTYARIDGVDMFYRPKSNQIIEDKIHDFLNRQSLSVNDIDIIVLGENGDSKYDNIYKELKKSVFEESITINYKHLCGEYDTSTAFATWMSARIIKENSIPKAVSEVLNPPKHISKMLIYNHFRNVNHSLILLSS